MRLCMTETFLESCLYHARIYFKLHQYFSAGTLRDLARHRLGKTKTYLESCTGPSLSLARVFSGYLICKLHQELSGHVVSVEHLSGGLLLTVEVDLEDHTGDVLPVRIRRPEWTHVDILV